MCLYFCVCHDLMAAAAAAQNYKAEGAAEPHTKKNMPHALNDRDTHTHQKKGIGHLHFIRKDLCDMRCGGAAAAGGRPMKKYQKVIRADATPHEQCVGFGNKIG